MPNFDGVNGYGEKNLPPDDELRTALLKYTRQNMTRQQQIAALGKDFGVQIGLTLLRKIKLRLDIPTVRTQKLSVEAVTQAVINKVGKDPASSHGPAFIKDQLRLKMIFVPRQVSVLPASLSITNMLTLETLSDKLWSNATLMASTFAFLGREGAASFVSFFGQALRMGGVGFSIYAYKDKYTDSVLWIKVFPDVRSAGAGGHIFLDFVEDTGFIPIQLTTDKGSEVGWMYAFMSALRASYAPDINSNLYPFHVLIKSVHNTVIEGFWRHLKEKLGLNLKDYLLRGKTEHLYNPHNRFHEPLFYWIFAPLIQHELDDFADWWNNHRVRHQHEKILPSGHVPSHAMEYPELFGALDCRIRVPHEAVEDLRMELNLAEGPKSQFQAWPSLTAEFDVRASHIYFRLGEPELTMANGWDIFTQMATELERE
ncbi:hypothetical protein MIND_01335200 [Mycena indigotica]|uniref:Integrase core domain-containing protein n=1 Tax=Mycena indigotica TaxID=2126181 RepID=A0A8H6S1N3_9AGAR|nr:uncharacterized protein MIND_01335200 [Mycena indigotica]KAF7290217.1 hypothetical protein MIND_01335200 [Mycena indigotica]